MTEAFYLPDGDRLVPTDLTLGPWAPNAQHGGPPSALAARALERCEPRAGWRLGRVTTEILGPMPLEPLETWARVARAGRNVEMLEASVSVAGGRALLRATAWRIRCSEVGVDVDDGWEAPPGPEHATQGQFFPGAPDVGYHTAMDLLFLSGDFDEPGPARAWLRMCQPLVAGEEPTPLQRVLVAADAGSGLGSALDFRRYLFVNTDLTVHALRPLEGEWVFMDSRTFVAADGVGVAESVIGDRRGRAGRGAQTLFVTARGH